MLALSLGVANVATAEANSSGAKPLDLKPVPGDERGNELKELQAELLVKSTEAKALSQIQSLIRKYRGTPLEVDLWFREAELYMKRSKTERFFELNRMSSTVVRLAPQEVKSASSRKEILEAIKIYDLIQKRFPRYHELDLVLFNNAFARQQVGQALEAEKLFYRVVSDFPNSPLVPDSHLSIGEIDFDRHNFDKALVHFNAIKNYPDSPVYPYGIYKAGWTQYNLRNTIEGLKELEKVVEFGKKVEAEKLDARLDLRKEALLDMTLFFSDIFPAKDAYGYFKNQASETDLPPTLMKLVQLYEHHSKYEEKRVVLTDVIDRLPYSEVIPIAYNERALTFENLKKHKEVLEDLESLYTTCDPQGRWARHQIKPDPSPSANAKSSDEPTAIESCQKRLNESSLRMASKWLKTWRKNAGLTEYADNAQRAFEIYLRRSEVSPETYEARYAYAELLFQRQKFRPASEQYAIVGLDPKHGPLSHDALFAAMLSLEKAVTDKWNDHDEATFKSFANAYIAGFPKGVHRLEVEFKVALIAYEKGRYDESAPIFLRLGQQFAGSEKGIKAQDLYLDILNLKKDYKGLTEYSSQLLSKTKDASRIVKLKKIYEQSYFLQIQKLEEDKKYALAVEQYQKFALENRASDLAEKAWWNSMQLSFKLQNFLEGARSADRFADLFPNSPLKIEALLRAAQTYESMAQLALAAGVLIKLSKFEVKNQGKWSALAADFYALSGHISEAKALYEALQSQKSTQSISALEKLAAIEQGLSREAAYLAILNRMIRSGVQPQASLAKIELVERVFKSGDLTQAFSQAKDVLNMNGGANSAKARARLIQAQILEGEFIRASVHAKLDRIAIVLAIKTEKLEKAQSAYQAAIKYGVPTVSLEAMKRLAGCYTQYVLALRSIPIPPEMNPADVQAFKGELEKLAIPLEEKGVETINQAVAAAKNFGLHDGSVAYLQAELDKMNMHKSENLPISISAPGVVVPVIEGADI